MSSKVLIVEDDPDSRFALSLLLELEGFEVITASDGTTALSLVDLFNPDLIITDICMPGMSGIELTRHIRSVSRFQSIPIIAITAAPEQAQQLVLDAGACACFSKPLDIPGLQATAGNLLSSSVSMV
jgi:two-component system, sensor histidine kinase and response regulator